MTPIQEQVEQFICHPHDYDTRKAVYALLRAVVEEAITKVESLQTSKIVKMMEGRCRAEKIALAMQLEAMDIIRRHFAWLEEK